MKHTHCIAFLSILFCTSLDLRAQWATDNFWLQAGNTMTAQQRNVRLFKFLAGAERGYYVFNGGASNPGQINLSLVDDDLNDRVEPNGNGRDLRFSTDDIARIFVQQSNGHVGIGNSNPSYKLDVTGWLGIQTQDPQLVINRTSGSNSALINFLDNGSTNASITVNSTGMILKGGVVGPQIPNNTVRLAVDGGLTLPRYLDLNEGNPANLAIRVRGDEALWYDDDYFSWGFAGNWNRFAKPIKIGNATAPAAGIELEVQGSVNITGELTTASDQRLKRDVVNIVGALASLSKLRPVAYRYRTQEFSDLKLPEGVRSGLLAQEVERCMPTLVREGVTVEGADTRNFAVKSVNYQELVPILISAVQELEDNQRKQEKLIELQQAEIKRLAAIIDEKR